MGSTRRGRRIALIVEDDPQVRSLASTLLEEAGLEVAEVESAEAAVGFMELRGQDVALIFADIRLAGLMDGVDLARVVAKLWPKAKLVVTSGIESAKLERLPKSATFMPKPWSVLDVLTAAEGAIEGTKPASP